MAIVVIFVISLCFGFSYPTHARDNDTFQINANGTIVADGNVFRNMGEYVRSDYFKTAGKRCGTNRKRMERAGYPHPFGSGSDCTLISTTIKNEYYPTATYTIPVVFHVIYKSDGTGNISTQRITDQITVLNEDYGAKVGTLGALGYNSKIQFSLAGITRTKNDSWHDDENEKTYKAALGWDQDKYLNVYVNSASGYLGYAYLPQDGVAKVYQGVVLLYEAVGGRDNGFDVYDQGRTLVHEVGHHLGLLHTFEGEGCFNGFNAGDLIADTNSENIDHYGCTQTYTCGTADPIHNYMNYTDDSCMSEFTDEQANRMICSLVHYRPRTYNTGTPVIRLDRAQLNFAVLISGSTTPNQTILVDNSGTGILNWTTTSSESWLGCTPVSGTNAGLLTVAVNAAPLSTGTYTGTITISANGASNSPRMVTVTLSVINTSSDAPPIGTFSTPADGATVSGSVPVTGWAIDDVEVQRVEIYANSIYIGDAIFVAGTRPDVEAAYPTYPNNHKAGWGYMLLTNFLPGGGNGTYILTASALDSTGHATPLGAKTIYVNNTAAVKPFGAIDTPTQGGVASGASFLQWGWALTPPPNTIPINGSTINVWVDGVSLGHPVYNINNPTLAMMFPTYTNRNGAAGYFILNTTRYAAGLHTIQWTVTDNAGNSDGVGSRYFSILNTGADAVQNAQIEISPAPAENTLKQPLVTDCEPVLFRKGYDPNVSLQNLPADEQGLIRVDIHELERFEIHFAQPMELLSPRPIGTSMDIKQGIFYWQPGLAYVGQYDLFFTDPTKNIIKQIRVIIVPKNG